MIRAIYLLRFGELALQPGDPPLGLLDRMEGSLKSGHPARQGRLFSLQAFAKPLQATLLFRTGCARDHGAD
jgi:hypothetical protein